MSAANGEGQIEVLADVEGVADGAGVEPGAVAVITREPGDPEPEDPRPKRKIAIVGYTASRDDAPLDDPSWECWGMNNLHLFLDPTKFDRWYNLHPIETILNDRSPGGSLHLDWLRTWTGRYPIYLLDPQEGQPDLPPLSERTGFPSAVTFPSLMLRAEIHDYYTNTVSWQIAHALWEAHVSDEFVFAELGLWGVDMAVNTEYAAQRPSVEFYLGLAMGAGVEITLPKGSDLLRTVGAYGIDDEHGFAPKMRQRLAECKERLAQLEQARMDIIQEIAGTKGAIDAFGYVAEAWCPPAPGGSRDAVVAEGAMTGVAQLLAEREAAERHAG